MTFVTIVPCAHVSGTESQRSLVATLLFASRAQGTLATNRWLHWVLHQNLDGGWFAPQTPASGRRMLGELASKIIRNWDSLNLEKML